MEQAVLGPAQPTIPATPPDVRSFSGSDSRARDTTVDEQLRRVEARLLVEAQGDPALERAVRHQLRIVQARFATATVQQFLPILAERAVRRELFGR